MNANELRIGNWLYGYDPATMAVFDKGYFQVRNLDIEDNKVNNWQVEGFADESATYEPIVLSPEILEKCGFENQKYEEWEAFAYKDTAICASWDGVEWVFKYGYDSDLSIASCEFLHQLQNLIYALTGEELNYKQ